MDESVRRSPTPPGTPKPSLLPSVARQRNVILAILLAVASLAWIIVIQQARAPMDTMPGGLGLTMGMSALAFVAMWTVMMVAMMFPASAPMILTFSAIQARKRAAARPYVPVSVFTASYVLVWALFGVVAFGFAAGLDWLAERSHLLMTSWPRIAGGLIVAAGVYQLTPLKDTCLSKCRSPVSFLLAHWRDGWSGAFVVGFLHGIYCAGCCWLLFVILVPLGVMNLVAMAAVTIVVFAEKTLPGGERTARAAAAGLIGYGLLVLVLPGALPGLV